MSNMDMLKSSAEYAGEQCFLLLQSLDEAKTHSQKERALKSFKKYISEYKPDVYDDDVSVFFVGGEHNGEELSGLLSWCGQKSSNHPGCLKRSAQNVIALISWLLSFSFKKENTPSHYRDDDADENTFLAVFLRLKIDDYALMELGLHVLPDENGGGRSGSAHDAFDILSLLLRDHKDEEGQSSPLDIMSLLHQDEARQRFSKWLQESAIEEERSGMAGLKSENTTNPATKHSLAAQTNEERRAQELQELVKSVRRGAPTTWNQVPLEERLPSMLQKQASIQPNSPTATSPTSPVVGKKTARRNRKKSLKKVKKAEASPSTSPSKQTLAHMASNEDWSDKEGSTESEDSFGGGSTDDEIVDDPEWEEEQSVSSPPVNQKELPGSETHLEDDALSLSLTTLTKGKSARRRGVASGVVEVNGKEGEIEEDPLGLNEIDLVAIERGRLKHKEGSAGGGQRRRGSLIGFNAKKQLLSSLRGGAGGEGKPNLMRSPSSDGKGANGDDTKEPEDGSILPTSTEFDPVSFLVLVHGQASLNELVKGRAYLQSQVGSGKSSLEELVRKNFDTFIRSADSIEHFSLAFHHVTGGMTSAAKAVKKHAGRRASFFGSDAHVNMLQQTVSLLDRVDLNALGELVIQSKEDARDAFGLLLSRGNRLRAFRSARACLAGYSSLMDAPNAMRSAILARPHPRFADAVAHWKRIKLQLKKLNFKSNEGGKLNWRRLKMNLLPKNFEKSNNSVAGAGLLKHVGEQADVVGQEIRSCLREVLASPPPTSQSTGDETSIPISGVAVGDVGMDEVDDVETMLEEKQEEDAAVRGLKGIPITESRRRREHRAHMSRVLKAAVLLVEVGAEDDEEEKQNSQAYLHGGNGKGVSRLKELEKLLPVTYRHKHNHKHHHHHHHHHHHPKEGEIDTSDLFNENTALNIGLCTWALALSPHLLSFAYQTRHFLEAIEGNATSFDALDHLMPDGMPLRRFGDNGRGSKQPGFNMSFGRNEEADQSDADESSENSDMDDEDYAPTEPSPLESVSSPGRSKDSIEEGGANDDDLGRDRRRGDFAHSSRLPIPVMTSAMATAANDEHNQRVSGVDRVGYLKELSNQLKRFLPLLSILTTKIHLDKLNMGHESNGADRRGSLFKTAKKGLIKFDPSKATTDPLSPPRSPNSDNTPEKQLPPTSEEDLAKVSKLFGMSKFKKQSGTSKERSIAPVQTAVSASPASPSSNPVASVFRESTMVPPLELIKCAEKVRDDLLQHAKGALLLVMNEIELILLGKSSFSSKDAKESAHDISVNDQLVFNISRMPLSKRALRCEGRKLSITSLREAIHIIADLYEGILCLDESISKKNAEVDGTKYSGGSSWLHDVLDKVKALLTVTTESLIQNTFTSVNEEFQRMVEDPKYFSFRSGKVQGDYSELFRRASLGRVKRDKTKTMKRTLDPSEINRIIHSNGVSIPDLLSGALAAFLSALEPVTRCRPSWCAKLVEECTASLSHTAIQYLSPNYDLQNINKKHKNIENNNTMKVYEFSKNKSYETYELICDLISYGPLRYDPKTESGNTNKNLSESEYDDIVMADLTETELQCLIAAGGREVSHHISKNTAQLRAMAKATLQDLHQANAIYSETETNLVDDGEHFDHRVKLSSASNAFAISGIILPHYIKVIETIFPPLSEEQEVSHFLNDDTDEDSEDELDELSTPTALLDVTHEFPSVNASSATGGHHQQHHLLLHEIAMSRIVAYCFTAQSHHHRVLDIRLMIEHGWLSHSRQHENLKFTNAMNSIGKPGGTGVYRVPSYLSAVLLSLALARSELDQSLGSATLSFNQLNASYAFGHIAGSCLAALIVAARLRLDASSSLTNYDTGKVDVIDQSTSPSIDGSVDMRANWLSPTEAKSKCAEFSFLVNTLLEHSFEATKLPHGPTAHHFEVLKTTCEDTVQRLRERSEQVEVDKVSSSGEEEKNEIVIDQCLKSIEEQTRTYLMCF